MDVFEAALAANRQETRTKGHDEIVLWVLRNAESIYESVTGIVPMRLKSVCEYELRGGHGFIDVVLFGDGPGVIVEVKTSINSLGALFRQLVRYSRQGCVSRDRIVVVSPDDWHADAIRQQGFKFVKCPPTSVVDLV